MCGIAGLMSADGATPAEAAVEAMADALAHRGPDGRGRYACRDLAMAHNRLAIIDLAGGDQPLGDGNGVSLIANAEIYNYVEVRDAFGPERFATRSDCEVPLHVYRRDGLDFAKALRGMYAMVLHDRHDGRMLLARDPFGIKPLYYTETAQGLAFASEPEAFIAAGFVGRTVARRARDELLSLQFTTGADTIYEGVHRLLPGETIVARGGRIIERRRISALPSGGPAATDEADALRRLDEVLMDSVSVHQRSDVPYGMFLSGGIDSTTLLAVMARLNDHPVTAFTAGFSDSVVPDERAHARAVAKAVGAEHVEVDFTERDFWTLLPQVAAALDDPTGDYAALPTYKLGRLAAKGLKVVLCGEGGDEMFAGYSRYRTAVRPWWRGGSRSMRRRGALEGLGVLRQEAPAWRDGIRAAESLAQDSARTSLQLAQAIDCADWLPHDLLLKLDRCLMAHGLEGRTPFLDPVIADFALRLPDRLKVRGRMGKWLLRRWLADAVPIARPFERKRGFTVPVGEWIAREGERIGPLVAAQPGVAEVCREDAVRDLFRADGKHRRFASWILLFYALWHSIHIQGRRPAGDAFETLAGPA